MKKLTKIALVTAMIGSSFAIANNLTPEPKLQSISLTGEYQKTADSLVFTVTNNNAEVADNTRKLLWSRCLVGQSYNQTTASCEGKATEFATWQDALNSQKEGWRVPNIKELVTIVEETQALPAVNTTLFPFGKNLSFYGHAETTETTGRTTWVTTDDRNPNEKCVPDPYGYRGYIGEKSDRTCKKVSEIIPAKYGKQASSPYIWSATPVADSTNESNADKAYGLDLADGSLQIAKRSGEAIGGYQDSANEKRARYVLLVKDL